MMMKNEALIVLEAKVAKLIDMGNDETWVTELINRMQTIPDEAFTNCTNFNQIRQAIEHYKEPKSKSRTSRTTTFLALTGTVTNATQKAD